MKTFYISVILILYVQILSMAQFSESFSGTLETWAGDVDMYIINDDQKLQLNADDSGISSIFQAATLFDTSVMSIDVALEFNPSANNRWRWAIWAATSDFLSSDGIFVEIGENGANDGIKVIQIIEGTAVAVLEGAEGLFATSPSYTLEVSLSKGGDMNILVIDIDNGVLIHQLEGMVEFPDKPGYHGLSCIYTSSRKDAFVFDNWSFQPFIPDTDGPIIINTQVESSEQIVINFNEPIDPQSIQAENFAISSSSQTPSQIESLGNSARLSFSFLPSDIFSMRIDGITDLAGNRMRDTIIQDLFVAKTPSNGELLITEILFNPINTESDFLEIYNTSEHILNLEGLELKNEDNGQLRIIFKEHIIFPSEYIAFTEDVTGTEMRYLPLESAWIVQADLPSWNNDAGNISLFYDDELIDALDYHEDWHSPILTQVDGVSLERISLSDSTQKRTNWTSSSSKNNFGTPGYQNSSALEDFTGSAELSLRIDRFTPNADGDKDFLVLDYLLDKPNFLATIKVYSQQGQEIAQLSNNQSLGSQGSITWDGIDNKNSRVNSGVFILYIQLHHADGDQLTKKIGFSLQR